MHDFKYLDLGYPIHPKLPSYGLYHPVFNCFLIVTGNESIAITLRNILSSRYVTHVVCLNTADNYSYNLVDNTNCELWTINQHEDLGTLISLSNKSTTGIVEQLIPASVTDESIYKEKQWALLCLHWIKEIQVLKQNTLNFNDTDGLLNQFLKIQSIGYVSGYDSNFEDDVFKILYLERDFDTAEQNLNNLRDKVQ